MKDINGCPVLEFKDIEVGDNFKIPNTPDDFWEFTKLHFNKANNLQTGKIEHFGDLWSVWIIE